MRADRSGIVKFLSFLQHRAAVRRAAYRYLSACWAQDVAAAQALSVKPTASAAAVELQGELSALKLRCAKLEESVFAGVAARYAGNGDAAGGRDGGESARRLRDAVAETCGGRCAVFRGRAARVKYAIGQRAAICAR